MHLASSSSRSHAYKKRIALEDLREILKKHCDESCRHSKHVGECMFVLTGSLRSIFDADADLNSVYSYSALANKCRRGRLGITRAFNRVVICAMCSWFDWYLGQKIEEAYVYFESEMPKYIPGCVEHWHTEAPKVTGQRCQSHVYAEKFI